MANDKKEVTKTATVKKTKAVKEKKTRLEDLPIETLSVYYSEITRIVGQCNNDASVCRTSENSVERGRYGEYMALANEFNQYGAKVDDIIKDKLREICGKD